jgi:hypothetical protein
MLRPRGGVEIRIHLLHDTLFTQSRLFFLFRCRYIVDATLQNYGNIVVSTTFFDNNSLYIKELIAAVAQSVEQWTENPCVISSILIGGKSPAFRGVFFQVRPAGRTSGRGEESLLPPT